MSCSVRFRQVGKGNPGRRAASPPVTPVTPTATGHRTKHHIYSTGTSFAAGHCALPGSGTVVHFSASRTRSRPSPAHTKTMKTNQTRSMQLQCRPAIASPRFPGFQFLSLPVGLDWAGVAAEFSRSSVSPGPRRSAVTQYSQRLYEAASASRPRPAN